MKLREIAHSRTGDKGNTSNISVIAYDAKHFPLLKEQVTAARVRAHFAGVVEGEVVRYELSNIAALNFVMSNTLGGGVTRSLALDAHGKSLSSCLLELEMPDLSDLPELPPLPPELEPVSPELESVDLVLKTPVWEEAIEAAAHSDLVSDLGEGLVLAPRALLHVRTGAPRRRLPANSLLSAQAGLFLRTGWGTGRSGWSNFVPANTSFLRHL